MKVGQKSKGGNRKGARGRALHTVSQFSLFCILVLPTHTGSTYDAKSPTHLSSRDYAGVRRRVGTPPSRRRERSRQAAVRKNPPTAASRVSQKRFIHTHSHPITTRSGRHSAASKHVPHRYTFEPRKTLHLSATHLQRRPQGAPPAMRLAARSRCLTCFDGVTGDESAGAKWSVTLCD